MKSRENREKVAPMAIAPRINARTPTIIASPIAIHILYRYSV
jgi:hypothetical protein